jgi:type IV pilus assembly protein PilM
MRIPPSVANLLQEPPPSLAFELTEAGVSVARMGATTELDFRPLKPGALSVSPLKDNVLMPDEIAAAVREMSPRNGKNKRRDAAVILPDYSTRIAVLDFDSFPSDQKEQLSLVRFRVRKSIPYDVEEAALSYCAQPADGKKLDVVVVVAPLEVVARYEAPFRASGLNPGLVTTSSLAALNLIGNNGITVVAKVTGRTLTVMVLEGGRLKLVRCLEIAGTDIAEIAADLYPTFIYIEDNLGARADRLLLCGFGERMEAARQQFHSELGVEVEPVRSPLGAAGENNAGLLGYLRSLGRDSVARHML